MTLCKHLKKLGKYPAIELQDFGDDCERYGIGLAKDTESYIYCYGANEYGIYLVNHQEIAHKIAQRKLGMVTEGEGESMVWFKLDNWSEIRRLVHPKKH